MAGTTIRGRVAKAAIAAALSGAMAFGGVLAPAATALASTVTVLESDGNATTNSYVAYKIFGADIDAEGKATNVSWTDEVKNAVLPIMRSYEGYYSWLHENGIISGTQPNTDAEKAAAEEAETVARFVAYQVTQDEAAGGSIDVAGDAETVDGRPVQVTQEGSFANLLAAAVEKLGNGTEIFEGTFNATEDGYYLIYPKSDTKGLTPIFVAVDSGTNISVAVKAGKPTLDKQLELGEDGGGTGKVADVGMGDTITFSLAATIPAGTNASGIVKFSLSDQLPAGLDYVDGSAKVYIDGGTEEYTDNKPTVTANADHTLTIDLLQVARAQDADSADVKITVTYDTTLNDSASIGASASNVNTASLAYQLKEGDDEKEATTSNSEAKVVTYEIDLTKVDETGNKKLADAKFTIKNENDKYLQADGSLADAEHVFATDDSGALAVKRIDAGTYTIKEAQAPSGYAELAAPITLTITSTKDQDTGEVTALSATASGGNGDVTASAVVSDGVVTVTVPNKVDEDIVLPITGLKPSQLGTIAGLALVAGAAIVIVRRRQSEQA